jgi:hypothetical protein
VAGAPQPDSEVPWAVRYFILCCTLDLGKINSPWDTIVAVRSVVKSRKERDE